MPDLRATRDGLLYWVMTKKIDFSKYSSIRIGSPLDVLVMDEVADFSGFYPIGHACNLLASPNANNLAVLSDRFDYIEIKGGYLHVGAATSSGKLASFCKKHDMGGFEFLFGLPGSIGGLVKMNAGMKEWEIGNFLVSILTASGYIERKDLVISYRYTNIDVPIFEAVFETKSGFDEEMVSFFKALREKHPKEPSCGSCFKNPKGDFAGRLIEQVGMKGFRVGDVAFSEKHANFLVNLGSGKFDDALELISLAQKRVNEEFGVSLEKEVLIL